MALNPVKINKGKQGPNIAGKPFKTSALVTTGLAVADKLVLGEIYTLYSVDDCEELGLDKAYDTTNNVVVFEHIEEFYRMAGAGVPLWLQVNAQTVTLAQMLDDATNLYCRKVVAEAKGEIHQMTIGFNPDNTYTETLVDGINSEVRAAIIKAQAYHDWTYETSRPLSVFLECRGMGTSAVSALNLRAIPGTPSGILEADKVSLVIAQDYGFASTLTGLAQKHAAIGTMLGAVAAGEVNQDIGEVETRNLSDEKKGKWLVAGLSNHVKVVDQEGALATLDTKGYIFADTIVGISGYRFNGDATCTPVIVDTDGNMNEHTIAYGRTKDFASRLIRAAILPLVRKVKPVDPNTGYMTPGARKDIEGKGNDVFADMEASGWISGGTFFVDPKSDILVEKTVLFGYDLVPYGTIGKLLGTSNLKIRK